VPIRKEDLLDADFIDAPELISDGLTSVYLTTAVVSTNVPPQTVVVALPADGEGILTGRDHPVSPLDLVRLSGTIGGADGTYTVATVVDDLTFTVVEPIVASTGGSISFLFPAGATTVGVDPTGFSYTTNKVLQKVLKDIDYAIGLGGFNPDRIVLELDGKVVYVRDGEIVLRSV
jgi:hypothetical protein